MNDQASSLRPLRSVDDAVATLRAGTPDEAGTRRAVLRVTAAVERSLRHLLRDDERAPVPVRLRALAREELGTDELLSELRRHDRIPVELAASVHGLLEARRRLEEGSALTPQDAPLALRVAERLEEVILRAPARELPPRPDDATLPAREPWEIPEELDEPPVSRAATGPRWAWLAGAGFLVAILLVALFLSADRGGGAGLDQGIALFRSGAYADAAAHFWRYAEANPDDPVPHLYLARIHRRMGRPQLAADELQKAIALAPEDADVQTELGFLLLDTGRAEVAVERFQAALRLDPEAAGGWIGLVRALREAGRPEEAERALAEAPAEVREMLSRGPAAAPGP